MKWIAAGAVVFVLGCGEAPTKGGETKSCTVTLSGAVNGTYDCRPATTTWAESIDVGQFTFQVLESASAPGITVSIAWQGEPRVQHYRSVDHGANGQVSVTSGSTRWYVQVSNAAVAGGSYDLDFASISATGPYYIGKVYTTAGTLDSALSTNKFGPADLSLHVTF